MGDSTHHPLRGIHHLQQVMPRLTANQWLELDTLEIHQAWEQIHGLHDHQVRVKCRQICHLRKVKLPKVWQSVNIHLGIPGGKKITKGLLKRHQAEQQKLLKEQQKEAQKQLKIQQEQLKVQEAQMRRMQEDQMRQFQEQQKHLQEEQDKQLKLLQQYADLQQQQQQQQQQPVQDQAGIPGYLENQPMPVYDYSTLGTLNLDYSTLGTLAYGTYPGTDQTTAALNAAYANAYWTMLYQQNPYLLANYTLPRIQPAAEEMKRERGQKRQGRARYRKNRHSKEATLITEDNRRYKSNPDSESSELFISGGSEEDRENADDFKNQLLAQKNKLKKMEEAPKGEEREEEEEGKRRAKSPKNQPIFMAELQKKLKDKQQKNQQQKKAPAPPVPIPAEDIYGIYGYVPGAPVPVPVAPVPPPPVIAPYIAPGAPQLMVPQTKNGRHRSGEIDEQHGHQSTTKQRQHQHRRRRRVAFAAKK